MLPNTDQLRIRIADDPAAVDRLACTGELAARLLERWPGAMIVFDHAGDARQGWLYLPDLRRARRRPRARRLTALREAQPSLPDGDSAQDDASRKQAPGHGLVQNHPGR